MITAKMINPLAACIVNRECVITRFADRGKQDREAVIAAYLEMAAVCVNEYRSMISSGSTDYYQAGKMLSKAAYAVRQASNVKQAKYRRDHPLDSNEHVKELEAERDQFRKEREK